jgi:ABC-type branched-subunit amino acid transport system substrate-binding protein
MKKALFPMAVLLFCTPALAAGCPGRFDPRAQPELPAQADTVLHARFAEARQQLEQGHFEAARVAFEELLGDQAASALFQHARFYLGLSQVRVGQYRQARESLSPFVGDIDDKSEGDLYAALAEAWAGEGNPGEAVVYYDRWHAVATRAERAYIALRVRALVEGMSEEAAEQAYARVDKTRPARGILAERLALAAQARGDGARAARLFEETQRAREGALAGGDPGRVGALLPLSGKRRLVGEAALRGLTVAAGVFDTAAGGGVLVDRVPRPFVVTVSDAGERPERAGAGVDELAAEGVIAIIGPVDKEAAEAALVRAEAVGMPLLSLDAPQAEVTAAPSRAFRIVISVEARAQALARHAYGAGARRFALLAPEIPYGQRAGKAFTDEVRRLGGEVVTEVGYAKDAKAFVEPAKKLAAADFDALFVPDTAARLELIAPQLAVLDLKVQGALLPQPKRGRGILLLATAEAITPKFLAGTGRYTVGAILAPGFYADASDALLAPYVARFRAAYGEDPTYLDAYAYDAALLVRAAVESGATDRATVTARLGEASLAGLTGTIRFDPRRQRADAGLLYVVAPPHIHPLRGQGP